MSEGELDASHPVLAGPRVHLCRTTDESKALNQFEGPAIIIASSGMMTGGRNRPSPAPAFAPREQHDRAGRVHGHRNARTPLAGRSRTRIRMFGKEIPVQRSHRKRFPASAATPIGPALCAWLDDLPPPEEDISDPRRTRQLPTPWPKLAAQQRGWEVVCPELGQRLSCSRPRHFAVLNSSHRVRHGDSKRLDLDLNRSTYPSCIQPWKQIVRRSSDPQLSTGRIGHGLSGLGFGTAARTHAIGITQRRRRSCAKTRLNRRSSCLAGPRS